MIFSLEDLTPLSPIHFFELTVDIKRSEKIPKMLKKSFLLPDTSELFPEERFADVWMAWHEEGLSFEMEVDKPFENSFFPDFRKGDSIELFIDTRNLKNVKSVHRFCHHFCLLPQEVGGVNALEITKFRSEETRPLMDMEELKMTCQFDDSSYSVSLFFPSKLLYGYEPLEFPQLGFTYQINRFGGKPGHFCLSSFNIENHPALWGSLKLV